MTGSLNFMLVLNGCGGVSLILISSKSILFACCLYAYAWRRSPLIPSRVDCLLAELEPSTSTTDQGACSTQQDQVLSILLLFSS